MNIHQHEVFYNRANLNCDGLFAASYSPARRTLQFAQSFSRLVFENFFHQFE